MGGSSLCPEVLAKTFGQRPGFPELRIVDSTDPAQVKAACDEVNLGETLVVVASKSGSTLEPNILKQFFFDEIRRAVGAEAAGSRFMAITDPGSKLEQVAKVDGFRGIFYGDPQIGGRYSALSNFGVVAATVAAGKTPVPKLIEGRPTTIAGDTTPISEKMIDGLRPMMRLVVTNGTAKDIADCGAVFGKTGEAEFPGGSHSWFAGYRGDLAFASLIVGGGSSEYAVRMTKFMFDSMPADYLA